MSNINENTSNFFENILEKPETKQLVSEIQVLAANRPKDGENIQLLLSKVPELSTQMNMVSEHLNSFGNVLNDIKSSTAKLRRNTETLQSERDNLQHELKELSSGNFNGEHTLENLPAGITPASLAQPHTLALYISSKENKLKRIESDLLLLQRKLNSSHLRQETIQVKVTGLQDEFSNLSNSAQKIVEALKQSKTGLTGLTDLKEASPVSANIAENTGQISPVQVDSAAGDVLPEANNIDFDKLIRHNNEELENLLANREYNLWNAKLKSMENQYVDDGAVLPKSNIDETLNQTKSAAQAETSFFDSRKYRDESENMSLTQASRNDINYYSSSAELNENPSKLDLDFENWLDKEVKQPIIKNFDPVITND
ncbi:hypothetical protein OfM1_00170 [Lactovum odontotermitis]